MSPQSQRPNGPRKGYGQDSNDLDSQLKPIDGSLVEEKADIIWKALKRLSEGSPSDKQLLQDVGAIVKHATGTPGKVNRQVLEEFVIAHRVPRHFTESMISYAESTGQNPERFAADNRTVNFLRERMFGESLPEVKSPADELFNRRLQERRESERGKSNPGNPDLEDDAQDLCLMSDLRPERIPDAMKLAEVIADIRSRETGRSQNPQIPAEDTPERERFVKALKASGGRKPIDVWRELGQLQ